MIQIYYKQSEDEKDFVEITSMRLHLKFRGMLFNKEDMTDKVCDNRLEMSNIFRDQFSEMVDNDNLPQISFHNIEKKGGE